LRSNQRRQRYEATAGQEALQTAAGPDPAAALEQAQLRAQVRQALQGMSPRAAQVLVLRQAGLSYAELAAALEVAPGSVGTLLARAEREFAAQFEKIGR
jgi:RNA polymerase sigma-70 factor (ECF subfamily)